jgi:hypothetical protein
VYGVGFWFGAKAGEFFEGAIHPVREVAMLGA